MTIQFKKPQKASTNSKHNGIVPVVISGICVGFPTTLWLFCPQKLQDVWLWLTSLDLFSLIALIIVSTLLSLTYIFKLAIDTTSNAHDHASGKNVFSVKLFGKEFVSLETYTKSPESKNNLRCISSPPKEDSNADNSREKDDNITERTAQSS